MTIADDINSVRVQISRKETDMTSATEALLNLYDQYDVLVDQLLAGPPPPVPPVPLVPSMAAPGTVRLTWQGFEPVTVGRVGPPVYGGTLGWDSSLIGGVPADWLTQGYADFSEAKPGLPWTLFAIDAAGTRYEVSFTPPAA